jgi:hypothetical protein
MPRGEQKSANNFFAVFGLLLARSTNRSNPMKMLTAALLCAAATLLSLSARAETNVVEAFACEFNPGMGRDDLDSVVKYYVAERSKVASPALQKMVSRIWTPVLGTVPFDFVWFNSNVTYREWGEVTKAFAASAVGAEVNARFDAVATCASSGLYAQDVLFNNLAQKPLTADPVVIESFLCTLNEEKSLADSDAAIAAWKPVFEKAVASTGASSFVGRRTPIISGSGFDLSYFAVWADAVTYADTNEAFRMSSNSAKSDALFAEAHRCNSALFTGHTLVAPPE